MESEWNAMSCSNVGNDQWGHLTDANVDFPKLSQQVNNNHDFGSYHQRDHADDGLGAKGVAASLLLSSFQTESEDSKERANFIEILALFLWLFHS